MISPEAAAQVIAAIVATCRANGGFAGPACRHASLSGGRPPEYRFAEPAHRRSGKQIEQEQAKLAAPGGKTLNRTAEAFAQLELQSKFDLDMYKTALTALEKGRLEATRTLKKVSVLQQPNLPQEATEPRRLYTASVLAITIMLLAGLAHLLLAIVRDHRD